MFTGLKAWFSESVDPSTCALWVENGGRKTKNYVDATYCFSASCCDAATKQLLEPDPHRRILGFFPTVLHPAFINRCLLENQLLENALDFAMPSEQLLPIVAQQRGEKDRWLLAAMDIHKAHMLENVDTSTELVLEKHLGLKKIRPKTASKPLSRCQVSPFAPVNLKSVFLKDIPITRCQLRLLRINNTPAATAK